VVEDEDLDDDAPAPDEEDDFAPPKRKGAGRYKLAQDEDDEGGKKKGGKGMLIVLLLILLLAGGAAAVYFLKPEWIPIDLGQAKPTTQFKPVQPKPAVPPPGQPPPKVAALDNELRELGHAYRSYFDMMKKPPENFDDFHAVMGKEHAAAFSPLKDGRLVFIYGVAPMVGKEDIVAYEKETPVMGGLVLLMDGVVRSVSADEFKKMPLARPQAPGTPAPGTPAPGTPMPEAPSDGAAKKGQ